MAYIVRGKITGNFLRRGKEEYEMYWVKDVREATLFKTAQEVCDYLSAWQIDKVDILDSSEVKLPTLSDALKDTLKLGDLAEGKKFRYANGDRMVFMKICQPTDKLVDWTHGECDARRYLHASGWGIWVVILESENDCPAVAIGRVILLNCDILVREVQ